MAGVVCGHCGATNPEGSRFCENCDGFLDWEGRPAEAEPAAAPPAQPTVAEPATPASHSVQAPAPLPLTTRSLGRTSSLSRATAAPETGPADAAPDPAAPPAPVVQAPAAPLSHSCPRCGVENDLSRRFCRHCGEWLVTPSTLPAAQPAPLGRRLRRAWWGGERGAYSSRLSRSTVGFRILATLAGVVVLALVLGLTGLHPIRRVTDQIAHVLGSGRVEGVTASTQPADVPGERPAAWAVDNVRGRGWATRWTGATAGDPDTACSSVPGTAAGGAPAPATASSLVLTFPAPTDVREIGIEAGLPADDDTRTTRWRPRTVELHWNGGRCQRVDLADDAGLQRFGVDQGEVSGVTITPVAGYPPTGAATDQLDIGEVTFWHR